MSSLDIILRRRNKNDTGTEEVTVPIGTGALSFAADGAPSVAAAGGGSLPVGGTDGQVLTKTSGVDGEADWETPAAAAVSADGWTEATALTYASATTFTVAGDLTETYTKGAKVKLTQTTAKYFYVANSSHAGGTTTVTVAAGNEYSLADAAITSPFISRVEAPAGFPTTFSWAPSFVGFSAAPTNVIARFFLIGQVCTIHIRCFTAGTSNATTLTFTAPIAARTLTNAFWMGLAAGHDNGNNTATPSRLTIDSAATVVTATPTFVGGAAWTGSGAKNIVTGFLTYEI